MAWTRGCLSVPFFSIMPGSKSGNVDVLLEMHAVVPTDSRTALQSRAVSPSPIFVYSVDRESGVTAGESRSKTMEASLKSLGPTGPQYHQYQVDRGTSESLQLSSVLLSMSKSFGSRWFAIAARSAQERIGLCALKPRNVQPDDLCLDRNFGDFRDQKRHQARRLVPCRRNPGDSLSTRRWMRAWPGQGPSGEEKMLRVNNSHPISGY
jgi:hypothetical protein